MNKNKIKLPINVFRLDSWQNSEKILLDYFYSSPVNEIRSFLKGLSALRLKELNLKIEKILTKEIIERDRKRIAIVKLIISLLPDSSDHINNILNRFNNRFDYELQFTLFCFLDEVLEIKNKVLINQISNFTLDYLLKVPKETAKAAWMAGDFLSDHWQKDESLRILLYSAKNAKYKTGRVISVKSLAKLLGQSNIKAREKIFTLLKELLKEDSSKEVRLLSKLTLREKAL